MATWPSTLPQEFEEDSYKEVPMDNVIRSSTTSGPPKQRRRFTCTPVEVSGIFIMSLDQLATFDTFYNTTIAGGSLPFTGTHPRTGVTAILRFKEVPSKDPAGNGYYKVSCKMDVMP